MKVIAYLWYGEKKEYQLELFFSIFSALKYLRKYQDDEVMISVISDHDDLDPKLPIDHLKFSKEEFSEWTRNGTYNHRAKMCALIKALDHYQVPVCLIDTDSYFLDNPAKLFDRISLNHTVMHHLECDKIKNESSWPPIVEKIGDGIDIDGISISQESPMFNSGVIGVQPAHRHLLEKSLVLVDRLYSIAPIFNIDQFAVGAALNTQTEISESSDIVRHYFGSSRHFIHLQSSRLFEDFTVTTLERLLEKPFPEEIGYPQMSFKDRAIARFFAFINHWDRTYRFAYLSYLSALHYVEKDVEYANVWAKIALQQIRFSRIRYGSDSTPVACLTVVKHDFRQFREDMIESLTWLDPKVKQDWLHFWEVG